MSAHFLFLAEVVLTAGLFALVEIQIEGPHGWAASLPTWRIEGGWTRWLLGSKPLTGYHFYLLLFIFFLLHFPFAIGLLSPSLRAEARILSFMILFWIAEDFLWFVLNPAFGLKRFRRDRIPWHAPAWWWIMPRDYWLYTPVAFALYAWSWTVRFPV
ncbi:MAG: hypothetical protein HYU36_13980 [Planctomycetes bacterium]|nr:hypothetical protein [Planctomycetota bacterium]